MNTISENTLLDQQAMEKHYRNKTRFGKYFNQFDATLATKIGLNEAIFIQKLHQLTSHKKNVKVRDGFHWYFNTFDTWQREYFPYWSEMTIKRIVYKLRGEAIDKHGKLKEKQLPALLITTDSHNKMKYYKDHTLWYRINYAELHKLFQNSSESTQVKAYHSDTPISYQGDTPIAYHSDTSSTTMNPTKNPPLGNRGGASINSNHEDSTETFNPVGSSESEAITQSVEEGRIYDPLSQDDLYGICKEFLVSPEDVVSISEEVIEMYRAGQLKVLKNTKQTTVDFLKARIQKGTIEVNSSEEMLMAIESEHPLQVARDKYVLLEMKLRSVDQDGKSLRKQYEECGDQKLLVKINALKDDFMKLKPKWQQAMSEYISLGDVYPERLAKLTSQ